VYGLEIEHTGVEPLTIQRQETAAKIQAAFGVDPNLVCQHYEWAPTRKIDAATGVDGNHFRVLVRQYQGSSPLPPDDGGFQLSDDQYNKIMKRLDDLEKQVTTSRGAALTLSESGSTWLVSGAGRWPVQNTGSMDVHEIAQWLHVLGITSNIEQIRTDNDYLEAVPKTHSLGSSSSPRSASWRRRWHPGVRRGGKGSRASQVGQRRVHRAVMVLLVLGAPLVLLASLVRWVRGVRQELREDREPLAPSVVPEAPAGRAPRVIRDRPGQRVRPGRLAVRVFEVNQARSAPLVQPEPPEYPALPGFPDL
jgi:hypothetical protein